MKNRNSINNKVSFSFQRFVSIMKKEFIQISRDKFSLRLPIAMPIMMMLIFGYAVNTEVNKLPTAVFDQSKTQESREYIDKFTNTGYFVAEFTVDSENELISLIDSGKAKAGIIIPVDFARELKENKRPSPQLVIDGSDPTVARTAMNNGIIISENYSISLRQRFMEFKGISNMQVPGIALNTKVWYNPNLDNNRFSIPGLVGLVMQNVTIMLTAFALVREKERGTIEQLIVTPIKPLELILAKLIPYILIGYAGFLFSLGICRFWFRVEITGSTFLLLLLGGLFVICALAIGIMISTFAQNQLQAMQITIIVLLPSVLLSGFIFPIESIPFWLKPISYLIPLTYFLNIVRGIILKGVDINILWQDSLALLIFVIFILTVAIKRFRKSLD